MLRVTWGYSDYLILVSTSSAKGSMKERGSWENKSGKLIRFIKILKILGYTMEKKIPNNILRGYLFYFTDMKTDCQRG